MLHSRSLKPSILLRSKVASILLVALNQDSEVAEVPLNIGRYLVFRDPFEVDSMECLLRLIPPMQTLK